MKRNEGFTLVELLVTMVVGSVIAMAATVVLLLGLRFNAISSGTALRQNTTRILMTMMEDMAAEGTIDGISVEYNDWKITGHDNVRLLSYSHKDKAIYTGNSGTPLMEEVYDSFVDLTTDGLLTVSVTTEDGTYTSSVWCRMAVTPSIADGIADDEADEVLEELEDPSDTSTNGAAGRTAFLKILTSQYRLKNGTPNPGLILKDGRSTGQYYAEWYAQGMDTEDLWNGDTPWCACFLSWGLAQLEEGYLGNTPKYANVEKFMASFDAAHWKGNKPTPGDIIFFDWDRNGDADHVGAVLLVSGDAVYTIEGNSAGMVALRKYSLTDERILGYGVLSWNK